MLHVRNLLSLLAVFAIGSAVLVGCTTQNEPEPFAGVETQGDWKEGLDEDVAAALMELPEADREAALAQKVCPVSDKPLGSMGKPPKVTVEGQEAFLCCAGCEEDLKNEPAKYLAKLNANK